MNRVVRWMFSVCLSCLCLSSLSVARAQDRNLELIAATYGNNIERARQLIELGADVNAKDQLQNSAYLLAGARGYIEILRMTLNAGADLKSLNRFGGTALIPACHYGHIETVRELLKTPVDVNHVNNLGWTALMEAVILGDGGKTHTDIVRLLLDARANPNIADRDGVTPLAHAKRLRYREMIVALEKAGGK